jgi:hypothetical protein
MIYGGLAIAFVVGFIAGVGAVWLYIAYKGLIVG